MLHSKLHLDTHEAQKIGLVVLHFGHPLPQIQGLTAVCEKEVTAPGTAEAIIDYRAPEGDGTQQKICSSAVGVKTMTIPDRQVSSDILVSRSWQSTSLHFGHDLLGKLCIADLHPMPDPSLERGWDTQQGQQVPLLHEH